MRATTLAWHSTWSIPVLHATLKRFVNQESPITSMIFSILEQILPTCDTWGHSFFSKSLNHLPKPPQGQLKVLPLTLPKCLPCLRFCTCYHRTHRPYGHPVPANCFNSPPYCLCPTSRSFDWWWPETLLPPGLHGNKPWQFSIVVSTHWGSIWSLQESEVTLTEYFLYFTVVLHGDGKIWMSSVLLTGCS